MIELIAEVSSNHGGSVPLAKEFIKRFADAGADWVKFQTTRVKHLRPDDPQYAWFKIAELSDEAHFELKACCEAEGVKMLTTVYHAEDVPFVASLGLEAIKIGSGEAREGRLAAAIATRFRRVIVGLGLAPSTETAIFSLRAGVAIDYLWTMSRYPCPVSVANIQYGGYRLVTGWSDHCLGLEGAQTAILNGATIIEKHVQLPNQARPAKAFEATVEEFAALRQWADDDPSRFLGRWQYA